MRGYQESLLLIRGPILTIAEVLMAVLAAVALLKTTTTAAAAS